MKAGDGGDGCISFRRERFIPRGGPNGGDGGKGGDVILQTDAQLITLLDLTYPKQLRAQKGSHGKGKDQTGKNGEDLIIRVPVGTVVRDDQTEEVLQDLLSGGQRFVVAEGGRGGRGNARFATPEPCQVIEPDFFVELIDIYPGTFRPFFGRCKDRQLEGVHLR